MVNLAAMSKSTKRLRFAVSAAVIVAGLALVGGLLQAMTGIIIGLVLGCVVVSGLRVAR